jgi:hypothetical protein
MVRSSLRLIALLHAYRDDEGMTVMVIVNGYGHRVRRPACVVAGAAPQARAQHAMNASR